MQTSVLSKGFVPWRTWTIRLVLLLALLAMLVPGVSCSTETQSTAAPKIILTAFRQQGFGTGQVPILVVAQVTGRLSRTHCVFFEVQFADANSIRLFYFSGEEIQQDFSDFTTEQHARCLQFNTSCLFGQISRKNQEYILQADLSGRTGGLLVASLYDRDCRRETQRVSLQTLAIGNSLFRDEAKGEGGESAGADGGTGE